MTATPTPSTDALTPSAPAVQPAAAGYANAASARQHRDVEWVLDLLAEHAPRGPLLDLGCGTGRLLRRSAARFESTAGSVGVAADAEMVEIASRALTEVSVLPDVRRLDLREESLPEGPFARITGTSMIHWLFPDERRLLAQVADRLADDGVAVFTSYHPPEPGAVEGFGVTDDLVAAAFAGAGLEVDLSDRPGLRDRTRSRDDLAAEIAAAGLREVVVQDRDATMQCRGAEHYLAYHEATFGPYYLGRVPAEDRERAREALGREAADAQRRVGYVTSMRVRAWVLRRA